MSRTPTNFAEPRPPENMVHSFTRSWRHLPINLLRALKGWDAKDTTSRHRITGGSDNSSLFHFNNQKMDEGRKVWF